MQQIIRTKVLVGILAVLAALGALLAHELRVNKQTAAATSSLSDERERARKIDEDDKAAIQKIRERNARKSAEAGNR